jgi:hypothetical protein
MTLFCRSFAAFAALTLAPASIFASVVTYMDVETLTRLSPIIVHGRASGVVSLEASDTGGIVTEVSLEVWDVFRGPADLRTLRVRILGGRVGVREARIFGTPRFGVGEEIILFARPTNAGMADRYRPLPGKNRNRARARRGVRRSGRARGRVERVDRFARPAASHEDSSHGLPRSSSAGSRPDFGAAALWY